MAGYHGCFRSIEPQASGSLAVALNVRDRAKHDVWRTNIETGEVRLDTENPGDVAGWIADSDLEVRAATAVSPLGAYEVRVRDGANAPWRAVASPGVFRRSAPNHQDRRSPQR
jgi:hypothetical protein